MGDTDATRGNGGGTSEERQARVVTIAEAIRRQLGEVVNKPGLKAIEAALLMLDTDHAGTVSELLGWQGAAYTMGGACASANMALLAWSPLAGGQLFGDSREFIDLRNCLERVQKALGAGGVDEVALAWLKSLPVQTIPILGTMRADRLERQVQAYRQLTLDRQDWYAILEAARGVSVP